MRTRIHKIWLKLRTYFVLGPFLSSANGFLFALEPRPPHGFWTADEQQARKVVPRKN